MTGWVILDLYVVVLMLGVCILISGCMLLIIGDDKCTSGGGYIV